MENWKKLLKVKTNKKEMRLWQTSSTLKETVSLKKLVMSNVITLKAIVNLMDKQGIIKKADLLEETRRLKA